jgi:hypothetical protein
MWLSRLAVRHYSLDVADNGDFEFGTVPRWSDL